MAGAAEDEVKIDDLPCRSCTAPQAADVKFYLGQGLYADKKNLSPGGLPLDCCRVKKVRVT
jgi:hypothetical protein